MPEHQRLVGECVRGQFGDDAPRLTIGLRGEIGELLQVGSDLAEQLVRSLAFAGGEPGSDHPQSVG